MITVIYTELRLGVYGYDTPKGVIKLLDTELAGRSHPMTSTLHVFLNTIINRYKDEMTDVFYPISINVVFPTQSYTSTSDRKHLLNYILERQDVLRLRERKSLMQACIEGWCRQERTTFPTWLAVSINHKMIIGAKENPQLPLKIKITEDTGKTVVLKELQEHVKSIGSPQEIHVVNQVKQLNQKGVDQFFNSSAVDVEFADNQEIPNTSLSITENFRADVLKNTTNIIFLHITNLYSKLPNGKPVFFLGGFVNSPSICDSLKENGLRYDYQTVFISDEAMPLLAAKSFSHDNTLAYETASTEQTQISTTAQGTTAFDKEVKQEPSPQSQTLIHKKTATPSKEKVAQSPISDEFIIEHRFRNQEFLLFKGYKKSQGIRRFYRFISHNDYKSITKRAVFIKLYKKVRAMYPEVSTLANTKAGQYYYVEDMDAKPLTSIIAQSRIKKGSQGNFKSEDIQLLVDLYNKLEELPITFRNMTADNIYVKQSGWWSTSNTNKIYFLGVSSEDSTKEDMTKALDEILKDLVHPAIMDRINQL